MTILVTLHTASSTPIKFSEPIALTGSNLTDAQLDYVLSTYPDKFSSEYTVGNVPIDATTHLTNPTTTTTDSPYYFLPTVRPNLSKYSDGYDFYFPQPEDFQIPADQYVDNEKQLTEMQPPPQSTNEPNYYASAANKQKKGGKKYVPGKKHINFKSNHQTQKKQINKPKYYDVPDYQYEDYYAQIDGEASNNKDYYITERPERKTPKASIKTLRKEDLNTGEYLPSILRDGNENNERVEFQMHGFNGPNSYKFGYDTGKG